MKNPLHAGGFRGLQVCVAMAASTAGQVPVRSPIAMQRAPAPAARRWQGIGWAAEHVRVVLPGLSPVERCSCCHDAGVPWPPTIGQQLPLAEQAYGIREKLVAYSLNLDHAVGGPKAAGFERILGIVRADVEYDDTLLVEITGPGGKTLDMIQAAAEQLDVKGP
jgi:hypothetical protein